MTETHEVIQALDRVESPRVLVVGDLILDEYVFGSVDRISPEAPIPVLVAREEGERLGGAGNVAANLAELGAETYLVGVLGDDDAAEQYVAMCGELGVRAEAVRATDRPTIRKSRFLAQSQQVLRVDRERIAPLSADDEKALQDLILREAELADAILVSDYAKGALSEQTLRLVFTKARQRGIKAIVDPKRTDFARYYSGASLVKPNRREASRALGRPLDDDEGLRRGMAQLIGDLGLEAIVITLGEEGIAYQERGQAPRAIPARAQAVFDVSGAGDTVLAVLGLMLAGGCSLAEAVAVANEAGGVVVGKVGTALVGRDEIRRAVAFRLGGSQGGKLIAPDDLARVLQELRSKGLRVVFTNGCFDVLHTGHSRLLAQARELGDLLVVAINSDRSVRELKGPDRPVLGEHARAELLGAMEAVDFVVIFDELTPCDLLRQLEPDVLVKGGDWQDKPEGIVGADIVEGYGGQALYVPVVPGHSTTSMVEHLGGEQAMRRALGAATPETAPETGSGEGPVISGAGAGAGPDRETDSPQEHRS